MNETNTSTPLANLLRRSIEQVEGKLQPTEEQVKIIDQAKALQRKGKGGVLVVGAGAGTGKTSTMKMLEDVLVGNGQYTAFNRPLVNESKGKFKKADCKSTHQLAFHAEGKRFAHRLNGERVKSEVIAGLLGISSLTLQLTVTVEGKEQTCERTLHAAWLAGQVLGAVKRFCQSADAELGQDHFKYIDGIDLPSGDGRRTYNNNGKVRDYLLPFAQKAWKDLSSPDGQLPFSHDHYVKVWQLNNPVISADYILLDEAQDTAPVFLDVLKQQKALVILVGDSAQQIYEWRGAVDAMAAFPGAPREYLTQSFRFGQAIADVANSVLASLEEPTSLRLKGLSSIASVVVTRPSDEMTDNSRKEPTKFRCILCRTNAAAVATVLNAIAAGQRPHLIGGGAEVVSFVKAARDLQEGRGTSHPELACFGSWGEVVEYSKLDEGEDLKLMCKLIEEFGCDAIINALGNMPKEVDADLVVSTAHKSKGREWESVQLASDFPTNGKSSDSDRKLLYVAATRAKLVLDVSRCPFFTGQDALEIIRSTATPTDKPVLPPTPSAPPKPQGFTWAKAKTGAWAARGPKGKSGETVEIVRRDGSASRRRLGKVIVEFEEAALYEIGN